MKAYADEEMVRNALGDDHYDEMSHPPHVAIDASHPLYKNVILELREIFDPEIPVNIYELGLIYEVLFSDVKDNEGEMIGIDISVKMTLTSPACPVAQEMPGWVQAGLFKIETVRHVDVEIVWDPTWDPSMMAETAKLQLNMFT
ncbi:MAG: iron-sulfur cluster assembly protein [Pseudobdellovibrionaceae bacterium]